MIRIMKALNTRKSLLKNNDKGFTLIELLVVVIIIGILAAIAVPIYLGVQQSSKDAAVQTDVTNAKIAVIAWATDNPTLSTAPALTAAVLGTYGFTQSANTPTLTYSGTATFPKFCVKGVGTGTAPTTFYASESSGVVKATAAPAGC